MGGFLETSKTVTAKDFNGSYWQQASVKVTVSSAGKVSWKISMSNDHNATRGRAVYLNVVVGDKTIQGPGYTTYPTDKDKRWLTYPTGNGTSKSGSFNLTSNSTSSLSISVYVCCMQNSTSAGKTATGTLTRTKWTDVGKGTITITDNGDNTFSITGTKGTSGTNNTASGPTLSWGYDTNYGKNVTNPNALEIKTPSNPTRTVYAKGVTKATYGANGEATTYLAIKQYVAPGAPGTPEISCKKSRLTIKENWTYTWEKADKANDSSPVAGYRIRLYRNGSPIKGLKTTTISTQLTLGGDSTKDYVDTEKTSNMVVIDPTIFEFVPGDKVKLSVIAYSKNGKGTQLLGNNGYQTYSEESLVRNAGVIRVRVNGSWKEGQVYIRVNGVWKEADVIKIKTPTGWKESE